MNGRRLVQRVDGYKHTFVSGVRRSRTGSTPVPRRVDWSARVEASGALSGTHRTHATSNARRLGSTEAPCSVQWELGGGAGHIHHLLPLADGWMAAGHDVILAMRDVATTTALMGQRACKLLQAPILSNVVAPDVPLVSWADLLLFSGYTGSDAMRMLLTAWLVMFERERPDLLIAEFAPAWRCWRPGSPACG